MNIIFYKNSAEPERVDKTPFLSNALEISGEIRDTIDITSPSIIIKFGTTFNYNYAYISDFNRYYYIDNMLIMGNDLWILDLSCDVLMTYKDDIYKNIGVIGRQEYDYNTYMEDDSVPTESGYDLDVIEWNESNDSDRDHKFFDLQENLGHLHSPQFVFTSIGGV